VAFAGDPLFEVKLRHLPGTGLITVAAADALFFIDDHRAVGQFGDCRNRTDSHASRFDAVLTRPLDIVSFGAVFGIGSKIDHCVVVAR